MNRAIQDKVKKSLKILTAIEKNVLIGEDVSLITLQFYLQIDLIHSIIINCLIHTPFYQLHFIHGVAIALHLCQPSITVCNQAKLMELQKSFRISLGQI